MDVSIMDRSKWFVSGLAGDDPSAGTVHTSTLPTRPSSSKDVYKKAMVFPSGDHVGWSTAPPSSTRGTMSPPSTGTMYKLRPKGLR